MGGDNIGKVKFAGNLGWKNVAWGGKEYSGKKIGKSAYGINYDKPLISWVPSIAVGNISFYEGKAFPEWDQNLLISASKTKMLFRLNLKNDEILEEEIIIRDEKEIGRIRDFEIDTEGNIFLISDEPRSSLWKIYRN
jgi:quinoprotein glucose dehydrogenase